MNKWFNMRNENGVGVINILGEIGAWGIHFDEFNRQLESLGNVSEIRMMINSDGGDVFDGNAIYNALQLHPARKTITVMGLAASMASVITMAGDRRIMPANAILMIHNPIGGIMGSSEEIVSYGEAVGAMRDKIADVYVRASGGKLTTKKVVAMMDRQSWITAEDAVSYGLATEVAPAVEIAAKFDLSRYRNGSIPANAVAALDSLSENLVNRRERSIGEQGDSVMSKPAETQTVETKPAEVDSKAVLMAERNRVKQIGALCTLAGKPEAAAKFIEDGVSLDDAVIEIAKLAPKADEGDKELSARHNVETGTAPVVLDPIAIWDRYNAPKKRVA